MNLVKEYLARCKSIINTIRVNITTKKMVNVALMVALIMVILFSSFSSVAKSGLAEKDDNELELETNVTENSHLLLAAGVAKIMYGYTTMDFGELSILANKAQLTGLSNNVNENNNNNEVEVETEVTEEVTVPVRENTLYNIVDDGYVHTLDDIYQDYLWEQCKEKGIEEYYELLLAQMYHESEFTIDCISETNDYGLMQINICNHDWLSKIVGSDDFLDPYISIQCGVLIMADYLKRYNDVQKALVCYNRGESAVINGTYSTKYSVGVLEDMKLLVAQ